MPRRADQFIDRFNHMYRNPDRACLISDRPGDRLPDPPRGVGAELVPALIFKFIYRLHKPDIAFLNQIEKLKATVRILLGDTDDKPQIRLDQLRLSALDLLLRDIEMLDRILDFVGRDQRFLGLQLTDSRLGGLVHLANLQQGLLRHTGLPLHRQKVLTAPAHLPQ